MYCLGIMKDGSCPTSRHCNYPNKLLYYKNKNKQYINNRSKKVKINVMQTEMTS